MEGASDIDRVAITCRVLLDRRVLEQRRTINALNDELRKAKRSILLNDILTFVRDDDRECCVLFKVENVGRVAEIVVYRTSETDFRFVMRDGEKPEEWLVECGVLLPIEHKTLTLRPRCRVDLDYVKNIIERFARMSSLVYVVDTMSTVVEHYALNHEGDLVSTGHPSSEYMFGVPDLEHVGDAGLEGYLYVHDETGEIIDMTDTQPVEVM